MRMTVTMFECSHIEQIVSTMEHHVLGKKDAEEKIALLLKITEERDKVRVPGELSSLTKF